MRFIDLYQKKSKMFYNWSSENGVCFIRVYLNAIQFYNIAKQYQLKLIYKKKDVTVFECNTCNKSSIYM